jgi:transporter family protein
MNWLAWSFLSAVFAALTAVLAKIGVAGVNSNLATAIRTTVILLFTWAIAAFGANLREIGGLGRRTWIFLVLSGVATGLSWLCYFRALQLGEVSKVAPVDKLSVVLAMFLAFAVLGERVSLREWTGAGCIVIGALLIAWK